MVLRAALMTKLGNKCRTKKQELTVVFINEINYKRGS